MQRAVSLSLSVSQRLLAAAARTPTRSLHSAARRPAQDLGTPARGSPAPAPASTPAPAARDECSPYRLQGRIPSAYDRKVLLWVGRFKRDQDIPEIVSIEMLHAARNKIRVQICYLMIALSVGACVVMVVSGKKAFKQRENLTKWNLEKKAKLKEQYMLEHGTVADKTQ
ncbi:protein FAM162A-like [Leucoraja erinacea]|uniref:protein FAM162A-like n=1 Tax=Leucoraja erinaceus TaxID=7782 RepID=UPI002455BCFB|nr:protein FAM162A-like [Leucoraja erinacea]